MRPKLKARVTRAYYRQLWLLKRWRLAWRYASGRLTVDDAQTIFGQVKEVAGWYPLDILGVDDVLELARDRWGDHPRLPGWAATACGRVYDKWDSSPEYHCHAEEMAMTKIEGYAEDSGVPFDQNSGFMAHELSIGGAP